MILLEDTLTYSHFSNPSAVKFHTRRKTKWTKRCGIQLAPDPSPLNIDLKTAINLLLAILLYALPALVKTKVLCHVKAQILDAVLASG